MGELLLGQPVTQRRGDHGEHPRVLGDALLVGLRQALDGLDGDLKEYVADALHRAEGYRRRDAEQPPLQPSVEQGVVKGGPLIACYWIQPIDPMWGPVKVERTGALIDGEAVFDVDVWAVRREAWCLNRDGEWELEPQPSSREDDWLATHRFTLDEALVAALVTKGDDDAQ